MVDPDVENCCQQCWENSNIGKIKFFFSFEKKKIGFTTFFLSVGLGSKPVKSEAGSGDAIV